MACGKASGVKQKHLQKKVVDPLLLASERPARKKVIWMTGQSHLHKWVSINKYTEQDSFVLLFTVVAQDIIVT